MEINKINWNQTQNGSNINGKNNAMSKSKRFGREGQHGEERID